VRVNGTLVEDKMRRFKGECEHFRINKCPIYTHDGASAKFSTNSQEMDNSGHLFTKIRELTNIFFSSILGWMRFSRVWMRYRECLVATALGSIPASSDTVESVGRQMKQC
jgi:hypothetical protein